MRLKRGVRLGRPFGIPLVVHGSWFPAAVLLVVHFTLTAYGHLSRPTAIGLATVSALAFFASLVAHEFGHALVARALGIPVVDITLFIFGGVARIGREPSRPAQEVVIAVAGPLVSLGLGLGGMSLAGPSWAGQLAETLGIANLSLAAFNLLPGFPLDGGRILRAFLWRRSGDPHTAALAAGRSGQGLDILLGLGGAAVFVLIKGATEGAWLVVVGAFLYALATASRRAAHVAGRLGRVQAGAWVRPFVGTLAPGTPLATVVSGQRGPYAVSEDGRLYGIVLPSALTAQTRWSTAADVMVPWKAHLACAADEPLTRALERLASQGDGVLVVLDDSGSVLGVLDHARVRERFTGRKPVGVG